MANVKALHKRKPVVQGGKLYLQCNARAVGPYTEFRVGAKLDLDTYDSQAEFWFVGLNREEAKEVRDYLDRYLREELKP